ncbi:MAG: hypothetical protein DMG81_10960 [Acidobacteria bacterium]|nr:MAG: hypothetical protein DMG81_10960 [Acidobacteriota bacterium]
MPKQTAPVLNSNEGWKRLFEAALFERDRSVLPARLLEAKHAIMDRIEDSIDSASYAERRLLLGALNTISELQRLEDGNEPARPEPTQALGQAA